MLSVLGVGGKVSCPRNIPGSQKPVRIHRGEETRKVLIVKGALVLRVLQAWVSVSMFHTSLCLSDWGKAHGTSGWMMKAKAVNSGRAKQPAKETMGLPDENPLWALALGKLIVRV